MLGALVLFFCLWQADYPKPTSDDLFYVGAGLNLCAGGDFSSPLLARQGFPGHFFFLHPPLYSYLLEGWLKLCGISSVSLTGLAILSCLIISLATIAVLRRHGAPVLLEWCAPLGVSFAFLGLGLRFEGPAVAFIMAGYALADAQWSREKAWLQFSSFALIFLGGSTAPRMTPYAAALALCAGWRFWAGATSTRQRWILAAAFCGALLFAGLTFLVLIDFRLAEFVHTFQFHATGRLYRSKVKMIHDYLYFGLGYLQMSLILLPLGLLIWAFTKPKDAMSVTALFLAGAVPAAVWLRALGAATEWWAILVSLLLAGSLLKGVPRSRSIALQSALVLLLLVVNRRTFAECLGLATGKIRPDTGAELSAALNLQPSQEHPLLVDGWTARYVYDYRLPAGVLDLEFGTPFPGVFPGAYTLPEGSGPQLQKGDIYVIGNYLRGRLSETTFLDATNIPTWNLFGVRKLTFDQFPRHVFIIPAESCKTIRPGASTPPLGR